MARVTILGAGDMGTALLTPLHAGGHELRLWGTERDAAIIDGARSRRSAPAARHPICRRVSPSSAMPRAAAALDGAEIVVVAITSNAIRP